jgi:hypothetical protein
MSNDYLCHTIRNLTPHRIDVYHSDPGLSDQLKVSFPPYGYVARAEEYSHPHGSLHLEIDHHNMTTYNVYDIPVFTKHFGTPVDLPDRADGVMLIVSLITALAASENGRTTDDLLVTHDHVRDDQGRIIGCRSFALV